MSLATMVYRDYDLRFSYRDGFTAGALVAVPITRLVSIQPELLYVQKGAYSNYQGMDTAFEQDYLEVPLLLRLDIPAPGRLTPFVSGGPAVSYLTRCHVSRGSGIFQGRQTCDEYENRAGYYHTVDYGVVAGAGVGIGLGQQVLTLGARYEWGLRAIGADAVAKHRVLSYLMTVEWPIQ
jgi:hypothetical protein